jgi:hypothetical protein
VLREGNLWLFDFRMPSLLPFRHQPPVVTRPMELLQANAYWHVAFAQENVAGTLFSRPYRVLDMNVQDAIP